MNSKSASAFIRGSLSAGLLLCSPMVHAAGTMVTFQVDMSNANFDPSTQTMAARGAFAGPGSSWDVLALTNNPTGPNPWLWTGTTNLGFSDGVLSYKYSIEPGTNFESVFLGGSHNRLALMWGSSTSSLVLPKVYYADSPAAPVDTMVTFEVNMAQQINIGAFNTASSSVFVRGTLNGWSTDFAMTNDPSILTTNNNGLVSSNVYTMTYLVNGSAGQTMDFKYYIDTGANWESPGPAVGDPADNNNRFFNLGDGGTQTLAPVYFGESPYSPVVTNLVSFQVDMSAQVLNGTFDPTTGTVEVRGNFNSWGAPQILCTNDLNAANTNLYTAVVRVVDGVNALEQYKFWSSISANSGWETMANNRSFNLANASSQSLPVVFFSNLNPADLLAADTLVTFRVDMTGATTTAGHKFGPTSDQVVINGPPSGGFANWDAGLPQLTNNPVGTGTYSIDLLIPKGSPVQQTYKYGVNDGMNPIDNEAASGINHIRDIRGTGTFVMPLDTFGKQVVETASPALQVSRGSADHLLLSWPGGPGVHLQSSSNLSSGSWTDQPETDGLSSTNWPLSGQSLFFRLIQQ